MQAAPVLVTPGTALGARTFRRGQDPCWFILCTPTQGACARSAARDDARARRGVPAYMAVDPLSGGGRVSNYRVRQVLALPKMPENQLRLLLALATYLTDDSRSVRIGFDALVRDSGNVRNTVRAARRALEASGKLTSEGGGRGPGDVPLWTVLCLPAKGVSDVNPLARDKGVSEVDPVNEVDPHPAAKGVSRAGLRGSTGPEKGGQSKSADLRKPGAVLNRGAKPQSSAAAARAAKEQDQPQVQEQPLANSQNRRVRQGPDGVADDAPHFPADDAESTRAGSTRARARRPDASAA